jgi:hypothetical protein
VAGKRELEAVGAERAYELLLDGKARTAKEVANELYREGLTSKPLHPTTVARAAKRVGKAKGNPIRSVSGKPKKLLNKTTKSKRLKFAKDNKYRNWKHVLFTDRKKFNLYYPGQSITPTSWQIVGEERADLKVNRASTFNVYAGLSVFGATAVAVVTGTTNHKGSKQYYNQKGQSSKNITQQEYVDVLKQTLLPGGVKLFAANGISTWHFQQDGDPAHKVAFDVISQYNADKGSSIQLLQKWPPNSPDLSPIENLWAYVQARVDRKGCKNVDEFKAAVVSEMKSVPKSYLLKLFNSMHKRMAQTIEKEGGKTKY